MTTSRLIPGLSRMQGRDRHEAGRVSTPLELLFDLTFVVAFSITGTHVAELLAEGDVPHALIGFGFAMFAIMWAWINFTWFASAFDTDDWFYRITTMVQMVGVIVFALGLPAMFASLPNEHLDNRVMVAGYVVMRLAMLVQWWRVAATSPKYRKTALAYIATIALAQVGWTLQAVLDLPLSVFFIAAIPLMVIELGGVVVAERLVAGGTPWHPHHIAERYSLLAIITLGEAVVGTVASVGAIVGTEGWSIEAELVIVAGIALTFGMWWMYFTCRFGDMLEANQRASFSFGYVHMLLFASIAGTGAGLHVAAIVAEGHANVSEFFAAVCVVVPIAVYVATLSLLYALVVGGFDSLHWWLLLGALLLLAVALALTAAGVSMGWSLVVASLAPAVPVIGAETAGRRRQEAAIEALRSRVTTGS